MVVLDFPYMISYLCLTVTYGLTQLRDLDIDLARSAKVKIHAITSEIIDATDGQTTDNWQILIS